jgi:phosphoribosylanthranilate isomerase
MRVRVKICGITRADDAKAAVNHGADAIGMVFHAPSPRFVDTDRAAQIARSVPPFVTRVGLFVNAEADEVNAVLARVALDLLQFHGDEPPEYCGGFNRPYIKVIAMHDGADLEQEFSRFRAAQGFLLDTHVAGMAGGSGQVFDWSRVPPARTKPVILAGGLNPGNVAAAIRAVRPYAVDVSSGVERAKGIKDAARIAAFISEVNSIQ